MSEEKISSLKESIVEILNYVKSIDKKVSNQSQSSPNDTNEIEKLKKEIELLNHELNDYDKDLEELQTKNAELEKALQNSGGKVVVSGEGISPVISKRESVMKMMSDILRRSLHNVNITVPTIMELADLELYDVKSTINIKASCLVDKSSPEHLELLQVFDALDNITMRNFSDKDRWICLKDNEELFIASVGETEDDNAVFYSDNSTHIKMFNSLVMESWLRSSKI